MRTLTAGVLVLACALVLGAPRPGLAAAGPDLVASIKAQLKTAIFHSGELAQRGSAVAATHLHLQHTINCLEGAQGEHFGAAAGYPCQGQGNGILPDLRTAVARGIPGAKAALEDATIAWTLATQALGQNDVNEAQPWARVVARYLQMASGALGR